MTIVSPIQSREPACTIELSNDSPTALKRLRAIFRWLCDEAANRHPLVPTSHELNDYITEPLERISAGKRLKTISTSRRLLQHLIAYEHNVPNVMVGAPLLRFIGYLSDDSALDGPFRISLRQAIILLRLIIDRECQLFEIDRRDGQIWLVTTDAGALAVGVEFRIQTATLPVQEVVSLNGRIRHWCAEDRRATRNLVQRPGEQGGRCVKRSANWLPGQPPSPPSHGPAGTLIRR